MARKTHTDILIEESYVDANEKYHSYKVQKRTEEETARLKKLLKNLGGNPDEQ